MTALEQGRYCQVVSIGNEDLQRTAMYQANAERQTMMEGSSAENLGDFLKSLDMVATVSPVNEMNLERSTQLINKSNQFNLTTKRYSEEQLSALASPGWKKYIIRVADRFGDNGIVGLAITNLRDDRVCEIDTFLLSCRVIGRTIETAFLATIAQDARRAGASKLVGRFVPTRKNAPAKDFYRSHGFELIEEAESGAATWQLPLDADRLAVPPWIQLSVVSE